MGNVSAIWKGYTSTLETFTATIGNGQGYDTKFEIMIELNTAENDWKELARYSAELMNSLQRTPTSMTIKEFLALKAA